MLISALLLCFFWTDAITEQGGGKTLESVYWALHVFAFSNCFHHTFIVEMTVKWVKDEEEEEEDNDDKGTKKDEEEDDDDEKDKDGKEKTGKEDSSLSRSTKVLIGKSQQTHPYTV